MASGDRARWITATDYFADGADYVATGALADDDNGADAAFHNAGIFRKTGSSAGHITAVNVNFDNSGTVAVDTGILDFTRAGNFSGHLQVADGAVLSFSNGTHVLSGGETGGAGVVRITGDSDFLYYPIANSNPPTSLSVAADYRIAGKLELLNGIVDLSGGSLTVGSFSQSGVSNIRGIHDFIVTGHAELSDGDQLDGGSTILQGDTTINGTIHLDGGRLLRNEGVLTLSGGGIRLNDNISNKGFLNSGKAISGGAYIENAADASFVISGNQASGVSVLSQYDPDGALQTGFSNAGTLRKTASSDSNTTSIGAAAFTNSGKVEVETGHLLLAPQANMDNSGTIVVRAGASFDLPNRDLLNQSTGVVAGDGTVMVMQDLGLSGIFRHTLNNAGTLSPGLDGVGHLTVLGHYLQTDSGQFNAELAAVDQFDSVFVDGSVALAGMLNVSGLNFNPGVGDSFTLMTVSGALTGAFDHVAWSGFDPKLAFNVSYLDHSVLLTATAVPIPAALWLFASGGLGLVGFASRRQLVRVLVEEQASFRRVMPSRSFCNV